MSLFEQGGVFMMPLSILAVGMIVLALKKASDVFVRADEPAAPHRPAINAVLQIGIFSFFLGILSQAIGLLEALQAIEQIGNVSPAMIAGGIKVSMIAPIYGLLIFLVGFLCWAVLRYRCDALAGVAWEQA